MAAFGVLELLIEQPACVLDKVGGQVGDGGSGGRGRSRRIFEWSESRTVKSRPRIGRIPVALAPAAHPLNWTNDHARPT